MANIDQRQMLPMGTVLDGRYRIVRYLSSGGFGNTYVAEDTRLGGQVAIKEFFIRGTNHRSTDGATVEVSNDTNIPVFNSQLKKFQREARRIFELRNNHIIHVSDLFDANGTSYYVMDLMKGKSLAEQTCQQPLSEQDARDVILQVLDALKVMHAEGLYHLDVKPGNIMRDANGHCTLIDFGASKQLSADERGTLSSSTMAYTPGYAPMEQVAQQSKNIGPWTDFFALGATLYRLVTGDPPPEVDSDDTALDGRQFPYPESVSPSLRHAISTLMNPSRRMRPKSAAEVWALLEKEYSLKEQPQSNDADNDAHASEETIYNTPTPDSSNEQTRHTSSPSIPQNPNSAQNNSDNPIPRSRKGLWYVLSGSALLALLFGILQLTKGCGEKKPNSYNPNEVIEVPTEEEAVATTPDPFKIFTLNDVTFRMIYIEGDTFTMGATSEQGDDATEREKPMHDVTLSDYYIGETEVTQALWKAVMNDNPSEFKGDNLPVEKVNWDDCQEFIRKLNEATADKRPNGREFRLPTEAEWEYAARGGKNHSPYKYAGSDDIDAVAWFDENASQKDKSSPDYGTHEVGTQKSNELGLYDMSGNILEWCQDWYDENYYRKSPSSNPCNTTVSSLHVIRGGNWCDWARFCRVANRACRPPDHSSSSIGLRLAL